MKQRQNCSGLVVAVLLCAGLVCTGRATELVIQSFDGAGQLSFNRMPTATVYRVEWAPTRAARGRTSAVQPGRSTHR